MKKASASRNEESDMSVLSAVSEAEAQAKRELEETKSEADQRIETARREADERVESVRSELPELARQKRDEALKGARAEAQSVTDSWATRKKALEEGARKNMDAAVQRIVNAVTAKES